MQALKNGQIDGIVVDMPTAFYVTGVQVDDGVIVGRLPAVAAGSTSAWSSRRATRSARCVNRALNRLWANGTIKTLQDRWLPSGSDLRVLR